MGSRMNLTQIDDSFQCDDSIASCNLSGRVTRWRAALQNATAQHLPPVFLPQRSSLYIDKKL